jgi:hypothetical protein
MSKGVSDKQELEAFVIDPFSLLNWPTWERSIA